MASSGAKADEPWYLRYGFSVRFPSHPALTMTDAEFAEFLKTDLEIRHEPEVVEMEECKDPEPESKERAPETDNIMPTANLDKAYKSTTNPLVDLFTELEEVVSGPRLGDLLDTAWAHDSLATLKIIFNCRSIHLGKASRLGFYKSAGWLAKNHPLSLITNLQWLSRPVIQKKPGEKGDNKRTYDDMVLVDVTDALDQTSDPDAAHDVRNGVAHGYWKDLLNLLALAANNKLDVLATPTDVLNVTRQKDAGARKAKGARDTRHELRDKRQATATAKFETDPVYRGLHLVIARLFAAQLKKDLDALQGSDASAKKRISLCAKWAPSHERFHDRHTYIVSTIAELLHPMPNLQNLLDEDESLSGDPNKKRELYLRHVREEYRKSTSALRKHLDVVERHISAKTYSKIKYDRIPSVAMNTHASTFIKRDPDGFAKYIDDVAEGKANISGATLLPSTIIHQATKIPGGNKPNPRSEVTKKVIDGQWKSLVQRIKDSGTLESSIAVCDVSGSMTGTTLPDGTYPIHSSIGLSLLVAEVAKPPFRGTFITFSSVPEICEIDLSKTLYEKYSTLSNANWGFSTNLVSVFEDLILARAKSHGAKKEDMVKRVFIFSDMHFNQSQHMSWDWSEDGSKGEPRSWSSSHERISAKYAEAGYEMPEVVYWNLAGGSSGDDASDEDTTEAGEDGADETVAPKPVTAGTPGTAIVSGYSQGMLKVFLDGGSFDDVEDEVVVDEEMKDENGEVVKVSKQKKPVDPLSLVTKAISHDAYSMLKVMD